MHAAAARRRRSVALCFPLAATGPLLGPGVARRGARGICRAAACATATAAAAAAAAAASLAPSAICGQDKREAAAKALVEELVKNQAEFEADQSSDDGEEEEEEDGAAAAGSTSGKAVDRALRRCSPLMVSKQRVCAPGGNWSMLPGCCRRRLAPHVAPPTAHPVPVAAATPAPASDSALHVCHLRLCFFLPRLAVHAASHPALASPLCSFRRFTRLNASVAAWPPAGRARARGLPSPSPPCWPPPAASVPQRRWQ